MPDFKGILIAGGESLLLSAIVQRVARLDVPYVLAIIPQDSSAEKMRRERGAGSDAIIEWNAGSPLSARTLIVSCVNRLQNFDAALLVCTPPQRFQAAGLAAPEIDDAIDKHIKSYMFLTREIQSFFKKRNSGIIAFASGGGGAFNGLLSKTITAAFAAFASGVVMESSGGDAGGVKAMGFSCAEALNGAEQAGDFAGFISKALVESKKNDFGKWRKFGKLSFWGK
ncbi:MAG: hypothetical protein LBC53_09860 [Spirochaetaceae bacterium]|jgi:hypothetical protein|nr:hypothetical protein [Spirochaetaceae bacterium]